ncbi:hypothetical protein [Aurantibacter sp.]|uniref:alpha-1,3-galactosidase-related protein n=1 Tax=Aurantibacter sp. TaxID=2807103 RepID=UPI0032654CF4
MARINIHLPLTKPTILILSLITFFGCEQQSPITILNMEDFMDSNVKDLTPIVTEVLEKAKDQNVERIVFPKGVYHFYPTYARDFYCTISNNDNGKRRVAFPLLDFSGIEIDGGDSEFIFHGRIVPFLIKNSTQVSLKNFSIDWKVPFALEGEVVARNEEKNSFDISISTPYKVADGHLYHCIEYENSEYEKEFGHKFRRAQSVCNLIGQNIIWDPKTMAPIFNSEAMSGLLYKLLSVEEIKPGVIRIFSPYPELPPISSIFYSKGEYLANRLCPGIRVTESKDLQLQNIDLYHAGAMGLIAERSENITLDNFNVKLKPEGGRFVSSTADATHFVHCKGEIVIRNSTFENMMDDAVNVHGIYMRVKKVLDEHRIAFETNHPHQNDLLFGKKGETVRIVGKHTLQPKTEKLSLKNVNRLNERVVILTFEEHIKETIEIGDGIENLTWTPSVLLENNSIKNNRARGFLLSTPKKIVVRNNHLATQKAGIRITSDLKLWNESGAVTDVLIENNTFEDCVFGGGGKQSVILIDPEIHSSSDCKTFEKGIVIRNNTFKTFDNAIISASFVDGLEIAGNTIIETDTYPKIAKQQQHFKIEGSKNVTIQDNQYRPLNGYQTKPTITEKNSINTTSSSNH